ncbi:MAG: ISNCY family transposase [Candidatus Binatia bacterium]
MRQAVSQATFADLEFLRQGILLDPVLAQISDFLDQHPELVRLVEKDLSRGLKHAQTGRPGLTAEQTLRSFILWRIKDWPYRELRERVADGFTLRLFTRFGSLRVPKYQAFQRSFSRLQPETIRSLSEAVVRGAVVMKIEDGTKLRVDTTVVETDVHYPTDSTLLYDGVRTISRLVLEHLEPALPAAAEQFPDRRRRARRRMQEISRMRDRRGKNDRAFRRKYRDLAEVAREVVDKAVAVVEKARAMPVSSPIHGALVDGLCQQILHYVTLTERVIDQARRRVFGGEVVAADQKLYSIFEPHTDLIKRGKARKPVEFGHKVFLAESRKGFITDYRVLDGNPPDSDHLVPSLERHAKLFERAPKLYAGDRGFDHPDAKAIGEKAGVVELCIPQRGGKLSAEQAVRQKTRSFKRGQSFRCGIEGTISVLFRGRGMKRCLLEGEQRFELFVAASVLAANLLRLGTLLERRARRRCKRPSTPALARAA